jgi:hypothetical protein
MTAIGTTPMNKSQLKEYYHVSFYTLNEWLAPIAEKIGLRKGKQTFTPAKVKLIIKHLEDNEE